MSNITEPTVTASNTALTLSPKQKTILMFLSRVGGSRRKELLDLRVVKPLLKSEYLIEHDGAVSLTEKAKTFLSEIKNNSGEQHA